MTPQEKSDLAYWFPKLVTAGVPVPRTQIIEVAGDPLDWFLGEIQANEHSRVPCKHLSLTKLEADLDLTIASEFGYPCFLRTGQTSGKHDFERNCLVQGPEVLGQRIRNLIEHSSMVDIMGLSCRTWAVRELLPVDPVCVLPRYGNMPLVVEKRCFVKGGKLRCKHEYWPPGAIAQGFDGRRGGWGDGASEGVIPAEHAQVILAMDQFPPEWEFDFYKTVTTVAAAFENDGAWSVDMLLTQRGWIAIDMAVAELSYHWPGCPKKGDL